VTDKNKIKEYFTYSDRLRTNVSFITGILIIIFNVFSGYLIVCTLSDIFLGLNEPSVGIMLIFIIPGIIAGAGLLKLSIYMLELLVSGIQIEKYSYLRMVLLISIAAYFIIMIIFVLTTLTSIIERKFIIGN
jgi:hypothetical protein